ncbi:hypothetical protein ACSBR1_021860 [Camellia fascicularis]
MALTSFFSLSISMLLLSLVVMASASGNGYVQKPVLEKPNTVSYSPKPELQKPKIGYTLKSKLEKPNTIGYSPKPELEKPKSGYTSKPELEKPKKKGEKLPSITGIQGLIYCKSGPKLVPIEGALARITCIAVDKNGYESAPFSTLSHPTDPKGYFFATLSPYMLEEAWKITECKAFLESSPLETCNVPTDVNKGINGAPLSSYHFLSDKNLKLYSVGPFSYTPQPKPASEGY